VSGGVEHGGSPERLIEPGWMPELPEVETVCRQLEPEIEGRTIDRLEVLDARWCRPLRPADLEREVCGRRIVGLGRRGKYLLLGLDDHRTLVMHLRMTGNLVLIKPWGEAIDPSEGRRLYETERSAEEQHLRARFVLDDGRRLWFTDVRRFGEAFLIPDAELEAHFRRLGIEPLSDEFTPEALGGAAAGRTAPLKSFLLDQSGVAGVGNIYADEALFRARLHPLSPAGSMRPEHLEALRDGVVAALEAGIDGGGASIDDFRDGRGERGTMQDEFLVHTREGEPCPRCGETILRIVVSGRSTYYCPACQVRLRRRPRRRRPATRST
jgi:formamidopyrimidine-DNA glycosylase